QAMTNMTILLEEQEEPGGSMLPEILDNAESLVAPLVEQEVVNIKNPTTNTALELVRDGGGMHINNSDYYGITYRVVVRSTVTDQRYSGSDFVPNADEYLDRSFILGDSGWEQKSGKAKVDLASSEDGAVVLVDTADSAEQITYKVIQGFSLSGRKIADVLKANPNTSALAALVDPNAVFPANTNGYRVQVSNPQLYVIFYEPGAADGSCF